MERLSYDAFDLTKAMDEIIFPDEEALNDEVSFTRAPIDESRVSNAEKPNASKYVSVTFGRFVTLVANHSFVEVVERNQDEEVILSTNLLTDLANSRRFSNAARGPLMVVGGVLLGIFFGYLFF